jgi:hypothetical protein
MHFSLYDTFSKKAVDKDLTVKQKAQLITNISTVNPDVHRKIYALIKVHYANLNMTNPYDMDGDIEINLDDLPLKLKQIIHKFMEFHVKNMDA